MECVLPTLETSTGYSKSSNFHITLYSQTASIVRIPTFINCPTTRQTVVWLKSSNTSASCLSHPELPFCISHSILFPILETSRLVRCFFLSIFVHHTCTKNDLYYGLIVIKLKIFLEMIIHDVFPI